MTKYEFMDELNLSEEEMIAIETKMDEEELSYSEMADWLYEN
jgi:hypothetical protein